MSGPSSRVFGIVDACVVGSHLGGWVIDRDFPEGHAAPIYLQISNNITIETKANLPRRDGNHGFRFEYAGPELASLLIRGMVTVFTFDRKQQRVKLIFHAPLLAKLKAEGEKPRIARPRPSSSADLTTLVVPVGTESADGSVIVGRDGYIFLYRGSNDLVSLYKMNPGSTEIASVVEAWLSLLKKRLTVTHARGVGYVQMILPEKSTILIDKTAVGLGPITPLFQRLDNAAQELSRVASLEEAGFAYESLVSSLRNSEQLGLRPFPKTDSHLSTHGCRIVIQFLLKSIAGLRSDLASTIQETLLQLESSAQQKVPTIFNGDISNRFLESPVFEILVESDLSSIGTVCDGDIQRAVVISPNNAGHIGTYIRWDNRSAPIKLRVVAFANSFFERGGSSRGLSWWCKHLFSEFHFVWTPELQTELLDRIRPEIVICQTVERFLPVIPPR